MNSKGSDQTARIPHCWKFHAFTHIRTHRNFSCGSTNMLLTSSLVRILNFVSIFVVMSPYKQVFTLNLTSNTTQCAWAGLSLKWSNLSDASSSNHIDVQYKLKHTCVRAWRHQSHSLTLHLLVTCHARIQKGRAGVWTPHEQSQKYYGFLAILVRIL